MLIPAGPAISLAALRAPRFLPRQCSGFLFASHWTWWLVGAILAATLVWLGHTRQQRRLFAAGLGVAAVVAVWALAASLVNTPAERLYAVHAAILRDASEQRAEPIAAYFAPDFVWGPFDRAQMLRNIDAALANYHIGASVVRYYHGTIDGRAGRSQINVFTQTDAGPVITKWNLEWYDQPGGDWQLTGVNGASFGNGQADLPLDPSLVVKH